MKYVSRRQPRAVICDWRQAHQGDGRSSLIATNQAHNDRHGEIWKDCLRRNSSPFKEERIMNKVTSTLIAAAAVLTLSGGAHAQGNNTLATPSTKSPVSATSDYGTPGATNSDSGTGSPNSGQPNSTNANSTTVPPAFGGNNTLATPTTKSPAAQ
jgi:hypothetical protein